MTFKFKLLYKEARCTTDAGISDIFLNSLGLTENELTKTFGLKNKFNSNAAIYQIKETSYFEKQNSAKNSAAER